MRGLYAEVGILLGFSALQRAENFSINWNIKQPPSLISLFQCSSASRKFLNRVDGRLPVRKTNVSVLFSEPKISQSFTA